jgi:hypothetical protein
MVASPFGWGHISDKFYDQALIGSWQTIVLAQPRVNGVHLGGDSLNGGFIYFVIEKSKELGIVGLV